MTVSTIVEPWPRPQPDPSHPEGYGVTWGPLGDRYVMPPRFRKAKASEIKALTVRTVLTPETTDIPDSALPRGFKALLAAAAHTGRLGRVTYSLTEITTPAGESELESTVVLRWRADGARPAGFAAWVNGRFDVALTRDMRKVGARGIKAEIGVE